MRVSNLLPAGVPLGLVRLRYRLGAFFAGAPVLFIGVVLGVAILFRLTIGVLKPAAAAEPVELAASPVSVAPAVPVEKGSVAGGAHPDVREEPNLKVVPSETKSSPPQPTLPRRKARTHGRR